MLFHSVQFLVLLGVTFALYWLLHRHRTLRLALLMAASLAFYSAWHPVPLLLFAWMAAVNAGYAWAWPRLPVYLRPGLVALVVTNHLGALALFKYANLFLSTLGWVGEKLGAWAPPAPWNILLPIGLSFVTFQAISYAVDVHRGLVKPVHGFFSQLLFLVFFPQVVAGPIVRASTLLERFEETPTLSVEAGSRGLYRIALGLTKKLLVADVLSVGLVDRVFGNPSAYSAAETAVAVLAYTFQIYFDFSAYSDIAIGVAALFGFTYPENFNKPYRATNLFEFWNRWHVSLSNWLRDYLYIPLGGNRGSKGMVLRNLFIVMVLGGLWHGADWRFALWGGIHGLFLMVWRLVWWARGKPQRVTLLRSAMGLVVTMLAVTLTRVIFRAPDLQVAGEVYARLFTFTGGLANVSTLVWVVLTGAVVSHYLPEPWLDRVATGFVWLPAPARAAVLVGLGLLIRQLASFESQPYIYSRF